MIPAAFGTNQRPPGTLISPLGTKQNSTFLQLKPEIRIAYDRFELSAGRNNRVQSVLVLSDRYTANPKMGAFKWPN